MAITFDLLLIVDWINVTVLKLVAILIAVDQSAGVDVQLVNINYAFLFVIIRCVLLLQQQVLRCILLILIRVLLLLFFLLISNIRLDTL